MAKKTNSQFNAAHYQCTYWKPTLVNEEKAANKHHNSNETLRASSAIIIIENYIRNKSHLFFDAGNCSAAALHYLTLPSQATSTIALGMGGMGYAIGAAVGAHLGAESEFHSLAFIGDGAFLMNGFEVHTAVELKLPILFVVFNNAMHGMCVTRDRLNFAGRISCATYEPLDFSKISQGFADENRLWTGTARSDEELEFCLKHYFAHPHIPGVLDLIISQDEMPPFTPFLDKNFSLTSSHAMLRQRKENEQQTCSNN